MHLEFYKKNAGCFIQNIYKEDLLEGIGFPIPFVFLLGSVDDPKRPFCLN